MAYNSETDALRQLLFMQKYGGRVTKLPDKIIVMSGRPYYFVEVTSREDTKYVIEAYGQDAIELQSDAAKRKEEMLIT